MSTEKETKTFGLILKEFLKTEVKIKIWQLVLIASTTCIIGVIL